MGGALNPRVAFFEAALRRGSLAYAEANAVT